MNELIKVTMDSNGNQAVSGRELHEFLELKTRYNDWSKRMFEYGFDEGVDFLHITQKRVTSHGAEHNLTDHLMSLDMAKEIAMIQRTDKGKQARQYFIEVEKKFKAQQINTDPFHMLKLTWQVVEQQNEELKNLDSKISQVDTKVTEFKDSLPFQLDECEIYTKGMKAKGVYLMGGKESNAYQNSSIRGKVYSSLHNEVKNQFGVPSYKHIKRKYFEIVMDIVANLTLPFHLQEEVEQINDQMALTI